MRLNVVPIGNSKGIRIPKAILQQCHIREYVDIEIENEHIVIKPYREKPRKGWEAAFEKMHKSKDDHIIINENLDIELKGWTW